MATGVDAGYLLHIIANGAEKTFPVLRDGFSLMLVAGSDGKHRTSSCKLSTRGSAALSSIMYASGLVDAWVEDDEGNVIFRGVIRPYASITAAPMHLGNLQLEIMDNTEKLHKKVYERPADDTDISGLEDDGIVFTDKWDGCRICYPADTSKSIVHKVCALVGITIVEAPTIDVIMHRFSLEKGSYLDDVLGTLLYEYIYDYRFDAEGKMHIFQTGTIVETTYDSDGNAQSTEHKLEPSATISVIRNSLDISRNDEAKEGSLVTYDKYKTQSNVSIYEDSMSGWPGIGAGSTGWWTFSGDIKWDLSQIKNDNGEDIQLSNFWFQGVNESWGAASAKLEEYSLTNCTDEGAHLSFRVSGAGGALFALIKYRVNVYADVSYTKQETKTVGYAGDNAEEYSAKYIESIEYAMSLASAIRSRASFGTFSYKFSSMEKYESGAIVNLKEADISGIETVIRITKRTSSDEFGLYKYEAEGYGSAEFSKPVIDKDEDRDLPQNQPDFFLMQVSDSNVLPDEEDNTPIRAEAWGAIFSKYGATPVWKLNGVVITNATDLIISISKLSLAPGINRLRCEAVYEGETYYVEKVINYISTDLDIQMQFAIVPSGQSPDSSTVWQDTQPTPGANEAVWMRFKTSSSSEWIVVKMTAEDGGNPIVYFQWAATPYIKPDEGYELLTWDDMAITWETEDDVMGFVLDSGKWEPMVPDKPFGLNYLWVKYWNYQTEQWDYFCTTGTPAMDFNLIVNPQTFKLTSRGVTQESSEYNDHCQRINVRCQRLNTTAPITWSVEPEDETLIKWERVNDADDSEIVIIINPMVALPNITIHCSIADIDVGKDFVVSGVQEGKAEEMYLGIYTSGATLPNDTAEGPLMAGDHLIIQTAEGVRDPYYWNGSEWVIADRNMPVSFGFKVLQDSLWDSVNAPSSSTTLSAFNIFAANLGTNLLFSYYAKLRNLQVGDGSPFSFDIYDYQNGQKVTPVIRAMYNGKVIFQIVPSTGNIFFGQPNNGLTEPEKGFMYRASDQTIRSKSGRFYIDANGYLHASSASISGSGSFSGSITATSGSFKGTIDCNSFRVAKSYGTYSDIQITISSSERSPKQCRTLLQSLADEISERGNYPYLEFSSSVLNKRFLEVTSSTIPNLKYIAFLNPQNNNTGSRIYFFTENMRELYLARNGVPYMKGDTLISGSTIADSNFLATLSDTDGYWIDSNVSITLRYYTTDAIQAHLLLNPTNEELINLVGYNQMYVDSNGFVKLHYPDYL